MSKPNFSDQLREGGPNATKVYGRVPPHDLSDRDLLVEDTERLRRIETAVVRIGEAVGASKNEFTGKPARPAPDE